jgi:hypothetical protein
MKTWKQIILIGILAILVIIVAACSPKKNETQKLPENETTSTQSKIQTEVVDLPKAGNISENLLTDTLILGSWYEEDKSYNIYNFYQDNRYYMYKEETSYSFSGSWGLIGNTLKINAQMEDLEGDIAAIKNETFNISIIDKNNIILNNSEENIKLIRRE